VVNAVGVTVRAPELEPEALELALPALAAHASGVVVGSALRDGGVAGGRIDAVRAVGGDDGGQRQ